MFLRPSKYPLTILGLCSLALLSLLSVPPADAATIPGPPTADLYLYVEQYDLSGLQARGCAQADSNLAGNVTRAAVVLDFGAQDTAYYGAIAPKSNNVKFSYQQMANLAAYYAHGYSTCIINDESKYPATTTLPTIDLSIGTNNSGSNLTTTAGQWWAGLVGTMYQWVNDSSNKIFGVDIYAASDMEPGFGTFSTTNTWLQAEEAAATSPGLINFGSADGCPTSGYSAGNGGSCNNGWNQNDVWLVSGGDGHSAVTPELYNSAQPSQWAWIYLYGVKYKNEGADILGTLDDYPSDPKSLTTLQAWDGLYNAFTAAGMGMNAPFWGFADEQSSIA